MMPSQSVLPKVLTGFVDVRDVAKAHVLAIQTEDAKNKRFILMAKNMYRNEVAEILKSEFGS